MSNLNKSQLQNSKMSESSQPNWRNEEALETILEYNGVIELDGIFKN